MLKNNMNSPVWNLSLLYSSDTDPQIDADMLDAENAFKNFAKKYNTLVKQYLSDADMLFKALSEYEKLSVKFIPRPLYYFFYRTSIDSSNLVVQEKTALLSNKNAEAINCIRFFQIAIGSISEQKQKEFLKDSKLKHFHFFLRCIFADAKHMLSVEGESILSLKKLTSKDMWSSHTEKILNTYTVEWKGIKIPIAQAFNMVSIQKTAADRKKLSGLINEVLAKVAIFAEGEINAVFTDKKIDDSLRKYDTPYAETIGSYRNDPRVIENLRTVVTNQFRVAHRFYRLKARLLKQKQLNYSDRGAKIGTPSSTFTFSDSTELLKKIFGGIDQKYAKILGSYISKGEIDAKSRVGKQGGAYHSSSYETPTFVLLNHVDNLYSFSTYAHEIGHAFHGELSKSQGPLYCEYSISLAETASTLFEAIALEAVYESLPEKEKVIVLHDKINDAVSTIFRQIACFNFELDLHTAIRSKGYASKEEIAEIHNKNMKAYLGPLFKMDLNDGYFFVSWSHIRRHFYVYTYAYGMLLSMALLRKYRQDKKFWTKIEQFLSAGGKDTPENIMKEIGIDLSNPDFFMEGIREIEEDIAKLEKLTK